MHRPGPFEKELSILFVYRPVELALDRREADLHDRLLLFQKKELRCRKALRKKRLYVVKRCHVEQGVYTTKFVKRKKALHCGRRLDQRLWITEDDKIK